MEHGKTQSAASLVSSRDVDGTKVYDKSREHIGSIDHLMIDKSSGKVAYAVMTFGGFLGVGEEEHTIPWNALHYDRQLGGFVTDITPETLKAAPERPRDWHEDRKYEERAHDHFGVPYYWL